MCDYCDCARCPILTDTPNFRRVPVSLVIINLLFIKVCEFVVCLDGSLPAYHLDRGYGAGQNNWLLQFEVYSYFYHLFFLYNGKS
jgi:hypothetical protein